MLTRKAARAHPRRGHNNAGKEREQQQGQQQMQQQQQQPAKASSTPCAQTTTQPFCALTLPADNKTEGKGTYTAKALPASAPACEQKRPQINASVDINQKTSTDPNSILTGEFLLGRSASSVPGRPDNSNDDYNQDDNDDDEDSLDDDSTTPGFDFTDFIPLYLEELQPELDTALAGFKDRYKKLFQAQRGIERLEKDLKEGIISAGLKINLKINLPAACSSEQSEIQLALKKQNVWVQNKILASRRRHYEVLLKEMEDYNQGVKDLVLPLLRFSTDSLKEIVLAEFMAKYTKLFRVFEVRHSVRAARKLNKAKQHKTRVRQEKEKLLNISNPKVKDLINSAVAREVKRALHPKTPTTASTSAPPKRSAQRPPTDMNPGTADIIGRKKSARLRKKSAEPRENLPRKKNTSRGNGAQRGRERLKGTQTREKDPPLVGGRPRETNSTSRRSSTRDVSGSKSCRTGNSPLGRDESWKTVRSRGRRGRRGGRPKGRS